MPIQPFEPMPPQVRVALRECRESMERALGRLTKPHPQPILVLYVGGTIDMNPMRKEEIR